MQQPLPCPTPARLQATAPRLLNASGLFLVNAYGLLVCVPILLALVVVSALPLGAMTFLLPLLAVAGTAFFLPFGFGNNPGLTRLLRALGPAPGQEQEAFATQLTLTPRACSGLRAVVEDADDIGWLSFTPTHLLFRGDSLQLSVPFEQIKQVQIRNVGWRGCFLYNPRITLAVSGLPRVEALEFTERSCWTLPGSRKATRRLHERLVLAAQPRA